MRPTNDLGLGVNYAPHTSTFVDPVPSGAVFVSASVVNNGYRLPGYADYVNHDQALTTTTSASGEVTAVTLSQADFASEQGRPIYAVVTLWFPTVQGGLTMMTNQAFAHWANGVEQSSTATNVQGTVGLTLRKGHGLFATHDAANNPTSGANPQAYTAVGAPLQWDVTLEASDDSSGGINSSLVAPVLVDKLPAHVSLSARSPASRGPSRSATSPLSTSPGNPSSPRLRAPMSSRTTPRLWTASISPAAGVTGWGPRSAAA